MQKKIDAYVDGDAVSRTDAEKALERQRRALETLRRECWRHHLVAVVSIMSYI